MVAGIVAGRLAVVTGAGSGIGRAACQVLSREGATVIAADRNYEAAVETIKTHTALASGANGGLDLIIAPGVAFSRDGARLGHGGGYYDKFITGLRSNPETAPKVVAVAFDVQVVDNVPMDPQDQRVDAVMFAE